MIKIKAKGGKLKSSVKGSAPEQFADMTLIVSGLARVIMERKELSSEGRCIAYFVCILREAADRLEKMVRLANGGDMPSIDSTNPRGTVANILDGADYSEV